MATDPKKPSQKDSKVSLTKSQVGECETVWLACGPPFDQRDYMVSPSESVSVVVNGKSANAGKRVKLLPGAIKVDCKYSEDSPKALKKLLNLIREGFAQHFPHRLKHLVQKCIRENSAGFFVEDIPLLTETVRYFAQNHSAVPEFKEFVKMMMNVAKTPPKIGKTSDVLHSKRTFVEYFTLFGELLATFEEESFQLQLLEALDCLVSRRTLVEVATVKLPFCYEAMEESQLPYAIAILMETVPYNIYVRYLELVLQMAFVSLKTSCILIQNNVLDFVLWRLDSLYSDDKKFLPVDHPVILENEDKTLEHYKLLDKTNYLIWGLLSIISKYDLEAPCPGENALWSLRLVFQRETKKATRKAINVRNNLAGLMLKLYAVFGEKLRVVRTGLVIDVALLSVATEIDPKDTWAANVKFGTSNEDYILKKLMLLFTCVLANNNINAVEALKSRRVIEGILHLVSCNTLTSWIPSQYLTLLFIGLRTLSELVPVLPEVYVLNKGNFRLLTAMKWFMEEHFDRDPLLETLKTFSVIASCKRNKSILDDIKVQNGAKFMIELCFHLLDVKYMKIEHQEKLTRVFLVLERLFENDVELQKVYGEACVTISIRLLERILGDLKNDSKWIPKLLVSFGGFIWEAVAWSQASLKLFIEKGGIFLVLDFIEMMNSFPLQMLFLGILVDMTDEGETIGHLLTWRGKDGYGILSMMIDIWRKEEFFTKVHRTKNGLIKDIATPLMTEEQWFLSHQVNGAHIYSASIAEMVCSARPKIHALYQFLQYRYFVKTQIGQSSYCMQLKMVKPKNQVYVPLLDYYVAMKIGEIWFEVARDVDVSGVFPTSFDGEVLCTLIGEKNKWASRIRTLQEEIDSVQQTKEAVQEKKMYNFLKSCRLASALEALNELDYIARTSFQKFQKQKKEKQIKDVEKSLESIPFIQDANIHKTFLLKTNATCLCGDYVWIRSEKEVVEHEEVVMVSSESSRDNYLDYSDEF